MPELALDDVDRHPFAGEFDGVGVSELVGREPSSDSGLERDLAQLGAGRGR